MFKIIKILSIILIFHVSLSAEITSVNPYKHQDFIKKMSDNAVKKMSKKSQEQYEKMNKAIEQDKKMKNYLIYFSSQSLNGRNQINITKEIARLQLKEDETITVAPIFRGFDDGLFEYGKKLHSYLEELPPLFRKDVRRASTTVRLNPKLFKKFNITEVPALISARCTNKISEETCKFYYKAVGEISVSKMSDAANVSIANLFKEKAE